MEEVSRDHNPMAKKRDEAVVVISLENLENYEHYKRPTIYCETRPTLAGLEVH